jgi:hypothetical protein
MFEKRECKVSCICFLYVQLFLYPIKCSMGLNHTKAASGGHKLLPDFSSCSNFNPWFEKIVYIFKEIFIKHHQCFQKKCLYIYRQFFLNSTHVLKQNVYIYIDIFFSNCTHVLKKNVYIYIDNFF